MKSEKKKEKEKKVEKVKTKKEREERSVGADGSQVSKKEASWKQGTHLEVVTNGSHALPCVSSFFTPERRTAYGVNRYTSFFVLSFSSFSSLLPSLEFLSMTIPNGIIEGAILIPNTHPIQDRTFKSVPEKDHLLSVHVQREQSEEGEP